MEVEFRASERSSLGVEIELQLVDVETGELVGAAPAVLAALASLNGGEEHPRIKAELYQCTLEVITGICDTVADARADLEQGIDEIRAIAGPRGVDLISAGLHPFTPWQSQERSVGERYDAIVERIQWPAKRLITHGVHYHVGRALGREVDRDHERARDHAAHVPRPVDLEPVLARRRHRPGERSHEGVRGAALHRDCRPTSRTGRSSSGS